MQFNNTYCFYLFAYVYSNSNAKLKLLNDNINSRIHCAVAYLVIKGDKKVPVVRSTLTAVLHSSGLRVQVYLCTTRGTAPLTYPK